MIYRNQIDQALEQEHLTLIGNLRQLWLQLVVWSRSLIVSTAGNLGDIQVITDRMMKIPDSFSGALGQYFDPQEADHFRELLEEHISELTALISAEKNNDEKTVNQQTVSLYRNAERMAGDLDSINPYWDRSQWIELLDDYIEMVIADLVARMAGNFAEEAVIFDSLQNHASKIADYMAQGMMQKFHP